MSALSAFLHPAVVSEEKEIIISQRFLDEKSKPIPFKVRALTQEENAANVRAATHRKKFGNQWQDVLDSSELSARTVVAGTVFPDFRSAELCDAYGTRDPIQLPGKMLFAGEYIKLVDAINDLSGFEDPNEEAKN